MPKLYGVLEQDDRMRVTHVSYTGNREGFVAVDNVLEEGEGALYVNPKTREQWREIPPVSEAVDDDHDQG